jgi:ketosteroid isomerase-like protein
VSIDWSGISGPVVSSERTDATIRSVPGSPISAVLDALDALDIDAMAAQFSPQVRLLRTDGRAASGIEAVRDALSEFVSELRATTHSTTAEWHPEDGVWIAELDATYELRDGERHGPYRRAVVLRANDQGITDLRFYGSHELPLTAHRPYQEVRAGTHLLPTL